MLNAEFKFQTLACPSFLVPRPLFICQFAILFILAICGCQGSQRLPVPIPEKQCPGKLTVVDAAAALAQQRSELVPMRGLMRCVMQWRDEKGKPRQEPVDGKMWFVPPDKITFIGDKFGEIRFGANESEFWLRIKPKEDTYFYGSRAQAHACSKELPMNPASLAEALGMIDVDARWELFHRQGIDLLTFSENGRPIKRVFVNCCDYHVQRIEYFDERGWITAATDLSGYAIIGGGLRLPTKIRVITYVRGKEDSSVQCELEQARVFEPTGQQMQLFQRPGRDGYGTVLRLNENCDFLPE